MASPFDSIFEEHEEAKRAAVAAERRREEIQRKAAVDFIAEFNAAIDLTAMPMFEQFVVDCEKNGYAASTERGVDGNDNPFCRVRFIPVKGGKLTPAASTEESFFQINGLFRTQEVEHASLFDRRTNTQREPRSKKSTFRIASMKDSVIQRGLEEFLKDALASREE